MVTASSLSPDVIISFLSIKIILKTYNKTGQANSSTKEKQKVAYNSTAQEHFRRPTY
jgi:hypothetical protein